MSDASELIGLTCVKAEHRSVYTCTAEESVCRNSVVLDMGGKRAVFSHAPDVEIYDDDGIVCGTLEDLLGVPVLRVERKSYMNSDGSYVSIETSKGSVAIRYLDRFDWEVQ